MVRDHLTASSVSTNSDLSKQASRIVASFVPTLLQVIMEVAYMTFAPAGRFPLWKLASAQPASNGFTLNSDLLADRSLAVAQSIQLDDSLIALIPAGAPLLFSLLSERCSLL